MNWRGAPGEREKTGVFPRFPAETPRDPRPARGREQKG